MSSASWVEGKRQRKDGGPLLQQLRGQGIRKARVVLRSLFDMYLKNIFRQNEQDSVWGAFVEFWLPSNHAPTSVHRATISLGLERFSAKGLCYNPGSTIFTLCPENDS